MTLSKKFKDLYTDAVDRKARIKKAEEQEMARKLKDCTFQPNISRDILEDNTVQEFEFYPAGKKESVWQRMENRI